jgi:hypothetical protein
MDGKRRSICRWPDAFWALAWHEIIENACYYFITYLQVGCLVELDGMGRFRVETATGLASGKGGRVERAGRGRVQVTFTMEFPEPRWLFRECDMQQLMLYMYTE